MREGYEAIVKHANHSILVGPLRKDEIDKLVERELNQGALEVEVYRPDGTLLFTETFDSPHRLSA